VCIVRYLSYRVITRVYVDQNTTFVAIMQTISQDFVPYKEMFIMCKEERRKSHLRVSIDSLLEEGNIQEVRNTVQLVYNVLKGAEYFCVVINECCSNREVKCYG
jgi:spore cortex formation protein SpoVR/YcgB (stage V sporulation)